MAAMGNLFLRLAKQGKTLVHKRVEHKVDAQPYQMTTVHAATLKKRKNPQKKTRTQVQQQLPLKGRKTLLCKASKVEIESTRRQGNPKIKLKNKRPNENKRRGLKNQPHCQPAHGVKIYAQGKTRTGIIARAQTQNNAQEKKGKPYYPKTPTRENSRTKEPSTILFIKKNEDILNNISRCILLYSFQDHTLAKSACRDDSGAPAAPAPAPACRPPPTHRYLPAKR